MLACFLKKEVLTGTEIILQDTLYFNKTHDSEVVSVIMQRSLDSLPTVVYIDQHTEERKLEYKVTPERIRPLEVRCTPD
jgi:hypothetical protein